MAATKLHSLTDPKGFVYHSNRGSRIFKSALEPLGGRPHVAGQLHIDLLYFDQYGGQTPPQVASVGYGLIDRQRTIPLDNKARMAKALMAAGINYPRVFFSTDSVPAAPESLWYIKNPFTSAGRGIQVVTHNQLEAHFKPGAIIQEAVQDLLLLDKRKFTLRAYVCINRGRMLLFPCAIVVRHGAEYEPDSLDPVVQFEHDGYMEQGNPVQMFAFDDFPMKESVMASVGETLKTVFAVFQDLLKYEKADRYCLFGIDLLVRKDLSTVVIEINDRPNIVHTLTINERVNIPMVRAMACVLDPALSVHLDHPAPRFEELAEL